MSRQVVVIGAGVAGCALAAQLQQAPGVSVTVLERGGQGVLPGSTGYAPGLVGILNEARHLTELARTSAEVYERLQHGGVRGFDRVGGLEVATSPTAVAELERRAALAREAGLAARLLTPQETAAAAPDLVDASGCRAGLLFAEDGTARPRTISAALARDAGAAGAGGARFGFGAAVTGIDVTGGRVRGVRTGDGHVLPADDVVLAADIWGPAVAAMAGQRLPLVPVAHPYVHGPVRRGAEPSTSTASPFVRWPEHHVYARDHGDRLGLGTYDHDPVPVAVSELGDSAEQAWPSAFEVAVQSALQLLPAAPRFEVDARLNGLFSMTADNQPLVGALPQVRGLWAAEALWVTHAAGAAALLARQMTGRLQDGDEAALHALRPDRFDDQPDEALEREALRLYRDIYATVDSD